MSVEFHVLISTMSTSLNPQTAVNDSPLVRAVRVVVHTMGAAGPNTSDNHWSIYLLLDSNTSVRINMRAEPDYVDGILDLTSQSYSLTTSAIETFDYPVRGNVRVCDMIGLIYQYRRNEYNMSGGGSGCRYWV